MDKKYLVYKHTNQINNKVYIGLTSYNNPEKRWGINGEKYKTCTYFYHAILKYGWNNFSHEILENNLSQEEAYKKEKYYIDLYNSNYEKYGYNLTSGGERNKKLSPISIEKPIQCVETGVIYKNKMEAATAVGLKSPRSIMSALKENWRTAGKSDDSRVRYHWVYFSEVRE